MVQIREGMRVTWENEQKKYRKVAKTHGMILVSGGASEIVGARLMVWFLFQEVHLKLLGHTKAGKQNTRREMEILIQLKLIHAH
jgi:hypothetical protein